MSLESNTPSVFLEDPDVTLWHGDALETLRGLPDESVHCVATSPPFFGLRDYGTGRWEGGDEGCDHGPERGKYAQGCSSCGVPMSEHTEGCAKCDDRHRMRKVRGTPDKDYAPYDPARGELPNPPASWAQRDETVTYRDVCGKCGARRIDQQIGLEASPDLWAARLVEVFREARRVLRKDGSLWVECGDSYDAGTGAGRQGQTGQMADRAVVNARLAGNWTNPTGGRRVKGGTKPKDLVGQPFLLAFALRADGWYWRGVNIWAKPNAMPESAKDRCTVAHSYVLHFSKSARYFFDGDAIQEAAEWAAWGKQTDLKRDLPGSENARGTAMGFDTYGRDRIREMQNGNGTKHPRSVWTIPTQGFPEAHFATWPEALARRILLAACPEGGVVLDPFGGSGTTALVARKHGRRAILIELNPEYCGIAARRLAQQSLLTELAS